MKIWLSDNSRNPSVRDLIGHLRRTRVWTLLLIFITFISVLTWYLATVWPIFVNADLNNYAVQQFMASEDFRDNTKQLYAALEKFNSRKNNQVPPPARMFIASSGAKNGLIVSVRYELVPLETIDPTAKEQNESKGVAQYGYLPKISMTLDPGYLSLLILIETCVLAFALMTLYQLLSSRKEEEYAIREYEAFLLEGVTNEDANSDPAKSLCKLLDRFHAFARQVQTAYRSRHTVSFSDEYDVQHAMHALLRMFFVDVRTEEYTPSYAGKNSRIDFLISQERIGVEVKMTRDSLKDKEIADELLIDIARYQAHARCETLICFIYDPDGKLSNPHGLISDLEAQACKSSIKVKVVISPLH